MSRALLVVDRDGAVEELRRDCSFVRAARRRCPTPGSVAVAAERASAARSQKSSTSNGSVGIVRVETHPGDDLAAEQPEVRRHPRGARC